MKQTRDSLYRCAQRVHRQLTDLAQSRTNRSERALAELDSYCDVVCRRRQQFQLASRRGLTLAAAKLHTRLLLDIQQVQESATTLLQSQSQPIAPAPPLALLIEELRGLRQEFEEAVFEPRENRIAVVTEPLVLEDVALGPFKIELHIPRLSHGTGSSCFDCVALNPNPADSDVSVTHPHVRGLGLCAGDATGPINAALSQGRLADAFLLVAGVLRHYNPGSPYVSLENWNGVSCPDCEQSCDRDDLYHCRDCDRDVCEDCSGVCNVCGQTTCHSCLELDSVSGNQCCSECRTTCCECDRVVDTGSVDKPSGLCPQCLAEQNQESPDKPEDNSHEPNTLEQPDEQASPTQDVAAA